jgi:hypothetical protein
VGVTFFAHSEARLFLSCRRVGLGGVREVGLICNDVALRCLIIYCNEGKSVMLEESLGLGLKKVSSLSWVAYISVGIVLMVGVVV